MGHSESIEAQFPYLYGMQDVFIQGCEKPAGEAKPLKIGVVLSGGQAAGAGLPPPPPPPAPPLFLVSPSTS